MGLSLVAFDTDHIKGYVFGTDRLKEIRGASSRLDSLNRKTMVDAAHNHDAEIIYANGGAGLFVVDENRADKFIQEVKQAYRDNTGRGASITAIKQPLPQELKDLWSDHLDHALEMMRYRLREEKDGAADLITLASHPFMRPCDACGINYALEEKHDIGEPDTFYCASCLEKRKEGMQGTKAYLWTRITSYLKEVGYDFPDHPAKQPERPNDFNEFSRFAEAKQYLGLIYADGNSMGTKVEEWNTLRKIKSSAERVDDAIHMAMSLAIKKHLPYVEIQRDGEHVSVFPFDILLLGGDDIVMVTDAAKALDVALTISQEFRRLMSIPDPEIKDQDHGKYSLSIGVVLAPVKYPFGLLLDMAEGTLKFAKKAGYQDEDDATRINFMTVTGGSKPDFNPVFQDMYHKIDDERSLEFYATLRPYKADDLATLLATIREGHTLGLGRTKLHQMREAILQKNATTAVIEGLAVLSNLRDKQSSFVARQIYEFGTDHKLPRTNLNDPTDGFPRITFPWFVDKHKSKEGRDVYRTSLLDFIELYDFVSKVEGGGSDN